MFVLSAGKYMTRSQPDVCADGIWLKKRARIVLIVILLSMESDAQD